MNLNLFLKPLSICLKYTVDFVATLSPGLLNCIVIPKKLRWIIKKPLQWSQSGFCAQEPCAFSFPGTTRGRAYPSEDTVFGSNRENHSSVFQILPAPIPFPAFDVSSDPPRSGTHGITHTPQICTLEGRVISGF